MSVHSLFADAIPELRPAEELLPSLFWEQYGQTVLLAGLAVVLLGTLLFWRRRKLPAVSLPPDQIASATLQKLEAAPDNSILAGLVLQTLRQYIPATLAWPPTKFTTDEIINRLHAESHFATGLKDEITALMRQCEQRQLSSKRFEVTGRLAARALDVVEKIEVGKTHDAPSSGGQP